MGLFDDLTPGNAGSFADLIPKPKPRGLLGFANDTVISAANQIAGGVGSIASAIVPGNRLSQFIDEDIVKAGEDKQSDIVKQSRARFQAEMEAAQGGWDEAAAVGRYVADNPMQTLAQAAGALALVGLPMSGIGKFVTGLRTGMGATEAAAAATAAKVSSGAGAALGGLMSGGDAAGTAYELVQKTPLDTLMLSPQAQELSSAGLDEKAIRDELGTRAARAAMPIPTLIGAGSGLIGAERILAGGKLLAGGALARGAQTALVEGGGEFVDEAATQYFGQKGAAEYNPTIDPTKGVVGAGLLGVALGAPTGGVVGALSPGREPMPDPVADVLNAPTIDDAIAAATKATSAPALGWNQRWEPEGGFAGQAPLYVFPDGSAATREEAADVLAGAAAQRNIEAWVARSPRPMPQEEAQALAAAAQERTGKAMSTLPLPDGKGWTVVPSAWVNHPSVAAYIEQASAAVDAESARQARITEAGTAPVDRAPRTGSTAPLMIDTAAPNAVEQFIQRQSQINTPAARAFVQEFRAGRITADDVMDLLVPSRLDPTPDARLAAAAAQAPKTTEGYLLTQDGFPYGSRIDAQARANKEGGEVVRVEGGFAVRPREAAPVEAAAPAPALVAADEQTPAAAPAEVEADQMTYAQRAAKSDDDRGITRERALEAVRERLAAGGQWQYTQQGDGSVTVAATSLSGQIALDLTPEETKALRRAEADVQLADTPEEKMAAMQARRAAIDPAVQRALAGAPAPVVRKPASEPPAAPAPVAPPVAAEQRLASAEQTPAAAPVAAATPASSTKFDPQGLKPGTPEYETAFQAWSERQTAAKAAGNNQRQRDENKTALEKRNAWRKRVRDWFLAASDGDTITDTGTGTTYKVVVKKRATGQTIKTLVAVDENGTPLPDGKAATGIGAVDQRVDGLDDASLDQETGSTTPETAGASLAASLGMLLESGDAVASRPAPAAPPAAPTATESAPAAPAPSPVKRTKSPDGKNTRFDFKTTEDQDGRVMVAAPGWRKGVNSYEVTIDRVGGPRDEKGQTKFYPTVTIGKYRSEASAIKAAEAAVEQYRAGGQPVPPQAATTKPPKAPKPAATPADPAAPQLLRKATNPERMSPKLKQVALNKFPEQEGTENVFMPYGPDGAGFYRVPKGWKAEAAVEAASPAPADDKPTNERIDYALELGGIPFINRNTAASLEAAIRQREAEIAREKAAAEPAPPPAAEKVPSPAPEPKPAPTPSANTIFTEDAAAAARARLKAKLGRTQSGIDPETMMDGITLAGYHIEKGARTFAAYARAMVDDLGDGIKPYLQSWYMAMRSDPSVNLALEASDAAGREFWRKIDNGESFTDQEVLDALSINRRGSRRTARGVAGTSGQASVGESVVRWANPIAGGGRADQATEQAQPDAGATGEQAQDVAFLAGSGATGEPVIRWAGEIAGFEGYRTSAAWDGDGFTVFVVPEQLAGNADLSDPEQARGKAIVSYAFTLARDGRYEVSVNDVVADGEAEQALEARGTLRKVGTTDNPYGRIEIGRTMSVALLQESVRRLALNIGKTPDVFYPSRDTGARAGLPDTERSFSADTLREKFSRGPGLRGKVSVRDARAMADELRTAFPRAPQIRILEKVNQAPRALLEDIRAAGAELDVEAAFHKGEIYVFPGNVDSIERLRHVMTKHEIRHAGFRGLLGDGMDRTMLALYEANTTVRKAADAKIAARLAGSKAEAVDEALADMTPEDIAAMTGARPLLAKLRLALRRLAGRLRAMGWTTVADAITPSGWSDADVVALVLKAESMALRGQTDGTRFSRAPAVLSEAFQRWFSGSKVVDADGKPLVVYHGTIADVSTFERTRSSRKAYYFAADPGVASEYTDGDPGGNVLPVFLALRNPMVIDAGGAEFASIVVNGERTNERALIRAAQDAGYDSLILKSVRDGAGPYGEKTPTDVFVAFRPEQIKSATGNAGTYDRTNPDIRYSRRSVAAAMADTINNVRAVSLPAGYKVADLLDSHGTISAWDKTVGTPFNLAKRNPTTFGRVYDRVQQFLNDVSHYATEAADLAPSILPKLDGIKDIFKKPLSAEDTKAIAAPIFEGTLTWTRDRMGKPISMEVAEARAEAMSVDEKASELLQAARIDPRVLRMWQGLPIDQYEAAVTTRYAGEMLRPGVVWTDAELRSMFKLNAKQIGLYKEFRASIDRSLDDLTRSEMIRLGGKDVAGMAESLRTMSVTQVRDTIADTLRTVAETAPDRAKALDKAAQAVADLGTKAADLKARGYAPLTRFGSYTLDVVDNGERVYFGMFESQYEANRMQRKMREQFPRATIRQGTQDTEAFKMFAGISPETIELFGEILGLDSTGDEASDKAFQTFLQKARSTRSAMKRLIHRKGINGFSEDAGRVLAGFLTSNARRTSSNMHLKGILDAVEEIPQQQGELKTYAAKMVDYVQNPVEEAAALRGLLFAQYLGGSIASALVNMSQPIMVSVPYLSQYGGAKQAAAAMVRAMKDMASGAKLEPALAKALKAAEEDGVVAPQEMHQLQAQARGQAALRSGDGTKAGDAAAIASNTLSRASLAWGKLFGFAELVNRRSTYIAAYRVGRAQGMADPDAFARQAVVETQFTYNRGNRPQWARGAIGATLFTFKTYSVSYVELLSRMAKSGPDGRRAALLAVALLLLMSGADGLPFMEDAEDVLDAFMQRIMGRNWSTKQKRNELLAEILGKDAGQFLQNGISGLPGVPIDVSGRMGMGNLIPGTGLLRKDSQPGRDMKELLGPVADLAERTGRAAGMVLQGDVGRAALEVSPVAARNVAKGADMIETGTYRDAKGRKVIDTTATEAIAKMAGFQPATVARVQEATNTVQRAIALNKTVEAEIADQWAQGLYEKDADKVAAARERLRDWNAANEDMPIKITFQQVRKRLLAMNQDKATRMEKTAPKEIRREIRRELAEAGR